MVERSRRSSSSASLGPSNGGEQEARGGSVERGHAVERVVGEESGSDDVGAIAAKAV